MLCVQLCSSAQNILPLPQLAGFFALPVRSLFSQCSHAYFFLRFAFYIHTYLTFYYPKTCTLGLYSLCMLNVLHFNTVSNSLDVKKNPNLVNKSYSDSVFVHFKTEVNTTSDDKQWMIFHSSLFFNVIQTTLNWRQSVENNKYVKRFSSS